MTDLEPTEGDACDQPFWLTAASYWQPAHFTVSAWLTHAPFAAWLMHTLRPTEVVELGTHYGFSCFAFAEAAARSGLKVRINAVDSWEGDDHAGFYGEEVYDSVRGVVAHDYPESVRMLRGRFSEIRPGFSEGSVDLLHIDGRHAYEDVTEDYTQWRTTVRDGGIIVFHDIAERDRGFGVWQLWEELSDTERTFEFHHGHGLGVLAVGEPRVAALRDLFSADRATADRIRGDYERLGAVVAESAALRSLRAELEQVEAQVRARAADIEVLQGAVADRNRLIEDRDRTIGNQDARITALMTRITDLESSTSWRVTAPMRSVTRLVRRR